MPDKAHHPPAGGGVVSPNFLSVEEALGNITFPISKRDLMDEIDGGTVLLRGRNVDLRELVKDLHDDYFESEEELHEKLFDSYATSSEGEQERDYSVLPTGPKSSRQADWGPGTTAGPEDYLEPHE